jgi:hypothetical protein
MTEVTPQTALLVLLGCLVVLTLFFMMVAAAALLVARLTGHGFMGPLMGMGLRMLSVKSDADAEDSEANVAPIVQHRHIDAAKIKAQSTESLDFERTVEKYRGNDVHPSMAQGGGPPVEAQAVGTPLPPQAFVPSMPPPPVVSTVPVTPIAPPIPVAPEGVPVTPITPPIPEPPAPLEPDVLPLPPIAPPTLEPPTPLELGTMPLPPVPPLPESPAPLGTQIPSENDYTAIPPKPPTLPDEDENLPPPLVRPPGGSPR